MNEFKTKIMFADQCITHYTRHETIEQLTARKCELGYEIRLGSEGFCFAKFYTLTKSAFLGWVDVNRDVQFKNLTNVKRLWICYPFILVRTELQLIKMRFEIVDWKLTADGEWTL